MIGIATRRRGVGNGKRWRSVRLVMTSSRAKTASKPTSNDFDGFALFAAMDAQRTARGLSWRQVADEIWQQSALLNARRNDHPISPATLTGIGKRGDCTCQHALFVLRWLGRAPENFVPNPPAGDWLLPSAGSRRRLRWSLDAVYDMLNLRRHERGLTWKALAAELQCTENQVRGIRTAKYAIGMRLAMRIVAWLEQPSARFIFAATW